MSMITRLDGRYSTRLFFARTALFAPLWSHHSVLNTVFDAMRYCLMITHCVTLVKSRGGRIFQVSRSWAVTRHGG